MMTDSGLESRFYLTCSFHPSCRVAWRAELRRLAGESFMVISNVSMRGDGRSNDIHGTYLLSLCARLLDDQPVPSWRWNYNGEDPIPPVTTSLSTSNIIQQSHSTFYNIATSYQVSAVPTCALSPWDAFYEEYPCILIPEDAIKRRAFDLTFGKCCMLNIANIFIEEFLSIHHVRNFALRALHVSVKLILTVTFSWCPFYRWGKLRQERSHNKRSQIFIRQSKSRIHSFNHYIMLPPISISIFIMCIFTHVL